MQLHKWLIDTAPLLVAKILMTAMGLTVSSGSNSRSGLSMVDKMIDKGKRTDGGRTNDEGRMRKGVGMTTTGVDRTSTNRGNSAKRQASRSERFRNNQQMRETTIAFQTIWATRIPHRNTVHSIRTLIRIILLVGCQISTVS